MVDRFLRPVDGPDAQFVALGQAGAVGNLRNWDAG